MAPLSVRPRARSEGLVTCEASGWLNRFLSVRVTDEEFLVIGIPGDGRVSHAASLTFRVTSAGIIDEGMDSLRRKSPPDFLRNRMSTKYNERRMRETYLDVSFRRVGISGDDAVREVGLNDGESP